MYHYVMLFSFFMGVSTSAVEPSDIHQFVKLCRDDAHVSCVRKGIGWLYNSKLKNSQKRIVYTYLSRAYLFLGKKDSAIATMKELVRLYPCMLSLSGNHQMSKFFIKVRREVLKKEGEPPVLSHIVPSPRNLLKNRKIFVKISDKFKIQKVTLFYRKSEMDAYRTTTFKKLKKTRYVAVIPKEILNHSKLIEYYIRASNCFERVALEGNPKEPIKLVLEGTTDSLRAVGGTVLLGLSAVLLIGSGLSFYVLVNELERAKSNPTAKQNEASQQRIFTYNVLAWTGLALSVTAGVVSVLLLLPPKKKTTSKKQISVAPPSDNMPHQLSKNKFFYKANFSF